MTQPTNIHEPDPDPKRTKSYEGRSLSFDFNGRRMVGVCEVSRWNGYTLRGHIPDALLIIRGKSGKTVEISLVESHATFDEL